MGAYAVGIAAPSISYFAAARGAAHTIYQIIDILTAVGIEMNDYELWEILSSTEQ